MSTGDDKKTALVRASSSALTRTGSQALARRGLRDLAAVAGETTAESAADDPYLAAWSKIIRTSHFIGKDTPVDGSPPAGLEEYYVIRIGADWHVIQESQVPWERESLPDGRICLRTPKSLHALLFGPFFSKTEAEECAELKRQGEPARSSLQHALESNEAMKLPRIVPHLWTGPDDVAHGFPAGCSFCGESDPAQYGKACPNRSCNTWYEVLGVPEGADENQINTAYQDLFKKWNPQRLQHPDDIVFDGGYFETQMKWFNAAYAVLNNPVKRQKYDAELLRQCQSNSQNPAKQKDGSIGR